MTNQGTRAKRRTQRSVEVQPSSQAPHLTQSMENYLLSIYLVEEQGRKVTHANLVEQLRRVPESEHLGTSLPSVSGMLRRMEKEQLIRMTPTREIGLTERGRDLAERIIRRHRLAACMIVEFLGVHLHRVNAEAHQLEHALSDELEQDIQRRLNFPAVDPFGQPIPGSRYVEPKGVVPLDQAPIDSELVVDRIPEDDEELVRYLAEMGVLPGVPVRVMEIAPYRGVVVLHVGGRDAVLGHAVASRVRLRAAEG